MSVLPYNRIPEVPQIVIRGEAWGFSGRLTTRTGSTSWPGHSLQLEVWPAYGGPGPDAPIYLAEPGEITFNTSTGAFQIIIPASKTALWSLRRARYVLRLVGPDGPRTILRGQLDIQDRKGERNV